MFARSDDHGAVVGHDVSLKPAQHLNAPGSGSPKLVQEFVGYRVVSSAREPIRNGNTESLRMALSRESIIMWHFRSFPRKRRRVVAWSNDPTMPTVLRFGRPHDLERWIRSQAAGG